MRSDVTIQREINLTACNTLALSCIADYMCEITTREQLSPALAFARDNQLPWWVLGGGSNVILASRLHGLVLLMRTRGIAVKHTTDDTVVIDVAAGEVWDDVVAHTLAQGWYGLENLSLIPGSCGAAPVQNIGAYGIEIAQCIESVDYFDTVTEQFVTLNARDCAFHYRDSIFKQALRGRAIITSVRLRLSRKPTINLRYPALAECFAHAAQPTPLEVRAAVIGVRKSKLPDPAVQPNVGSFFKNPVVSQQHFQQLQQQDAALPSYPQADGSVKLAAGYLVEKCGWKGRVCNTVQVHERQALVLINRGGANAGDLLRVSDAIKNDVRDRYQVELTIEPDCLQ